MPRERLPKFIIIGAAKAATTWIAHQLRERDDVFLPGPEPHFFSRAFDRGEEYYASLFADARGDQLIGEKSADYLAHPDAARRIAAMLPDVQLIVQLRNPIERAYSDYCMLVRRGQAGRDIEAYLDRDRTPEPRFLEDGLYARHIGRFLDYFPRERLKIILYEDIANHPRRILGEVCTTLALSPPFAMRVGAERVNDGSAPLLPMPLRRLPHPFKAGVRPLRGNPAFERIRSLLARPFRYPPLRGDVRARLEQFYRDDVETLGKLLGCNLDDWIAPAELIA